MLSTLELLIKVEEILRASQLEVGQSSTKPAEKTKSSLLTNDEAQAKKAQALARREQERLDRLAHVPAMIKALKQALPGQGSQYIDDLFKSIVADATNDNLLPNELASIRPPVSNLGFSRRVYQAILPYAKLARLIEKNGSPTEHAYKLAVIFGDPVKAIQYIQTYAQENKKDSQPFHNACLFQLPSAGPDWNINAWREMANSGQKPMLNAKFRQCLARAREIEEKLGMKFEKATMSEIRKCYGLLLYKGVTEETMEIAETFNHYNASQRDFDKYVQEILPQARLKNMAVNNTMIPDTVFDGSLVGFPGYYIEKLHHLDPMCAMLGHKVACCQSLGGQGEPCAIYGITHERSGFYVLRKGDPNNRKANDDIKAQSWAWRGSNDALVLDSVEVQDNVLEAQIGEHDGNDLICAMFQGFSAQLIERHGVPEVRVGTAGQTPNKVGEDNIPWDKYSYFVNYTGYNDSRHQRLILHKDALWIRYIDDLPDKSDELFKFLNDVLAKNSDVEIIQIPSMMNFIIWAMENTNETLSKFMSQDALKGSKHLEQLKALMGHAQKIQDNINDRDKLIEIIASPDIPANLFLVSFIDNFNRRLPLLHLAVAWDDFSLFEALIKRGIDINMVAGEDRFTPLHRAIDRGYIEFFEKLINMNRIDLNAADWDGNTPLTLTIVKHQDALAQKLIKSGRVDLNADNYDADTALNLAIINGNLRITSLLLSQPDIDLPSFDQLLSSLKELGLLIANRQLKYSLNDLEALIRVLAPMFKAKIQNCDQLERLLREISRPSCNKIILIEIGKGIQQLVKNTDDYINIINRFSVNDQLLFMQLFGSPSNIIQDLKDFEKMAKSLPDDSSREMIKQLGDKIKILINSYDLYERYLTFFDYGTQKLITLQLLDEFPDYKLNADELLHILTRLTSSNQKADLINKFGPKLNTLLTDHRDFFSVLESLPRERRIAFINYINDETFSNYFKKGMSLPGLLERLPEPEHVVVIDKLKSNFPVINAKDLYKIFIHISDDASFKMFQYLDMKDKDKTISLLGEMINLYHLKSHPIWVKWSKKIPPEILEKLDQGSSTSRPTF